MLCFSEAVTKLILFKQTMNSHNMLKVMQTENSCEIVLLVTDGVIIKGNTPFCDLTLGSSHLTEPDALSGVIEGQGI